MIFPPPDGFVVAREGEIHVRAMREARFEDAVVVNVTVRARRPGEDEDFVATYRRRGWLEVRVSPKGRWYGAKFEDWPRHGKHLRVEHSQTRKGRDGRTHRVDRLACAYWIEGAAYQRVIEAFLGSDELAEVGGRIRSED